MKIELRQLRRKEDLTQKEIDEIVLQSHFLFMDDPVLCDEVQRLIALTDYLGEIGHPFCVK